MLFSSSREMGNSQVKNGIQRHGKCPLIPVIFSPTMQQIATSCDPHDTGLSALLAGAL
jgi:hypothetical protein